jgi:glutamine cyclotransferase
MRLLATAAMAATMGIAVSLGMAGCSGDEPQGNNPPEQPAFPAATVARPAVVASFPHDTSSFTEGIFWHDGALYESTGRNGLSLVRKVEPATGKVLQQVRLDTTYFGEGLTLLGGKLYQLTWQTHVGLVYDPVTFKQVSSFSFDGEGWGLTNDGKSLVMSDGTDRIRFLDPVNFQIVRTIDVRDGSIPVTQLNELEWIRGELWANVWHTDRIARIDPGNGRVIQWLDLSGLLKPGDVTDREAVLNGIAYDAEHDRVLVTGKLWPKIFEIRLPAASSSVAGASRAAPSSDSAAAK